MAAVSQSPIKVDSVTKEKIRIAAAVLGRRQSDLVGEAVGEYIERHSAEFDQGMAEARRALALGSDAAVSHLTGDDTETIRRVSGRGPVAKAS